MTAVLTFRRLPLTTRRPSTSLTIDTARANRPRRHHSRHEYSLPDTLVVVVAVRQRRRCARGRERGGSEVDPIKAVEAVMDGFA